MQRLAYARADVGTVLGVTNVFHWETLGERHGIGALPKYGSIAPEVSNRIHLGL